jgi:hypothetical protein
MRSVTRRGGASTLILGKFLPFGSSYDDTCSVLFAENLRRFVDGAPVLNLVDRVREC